MGRKIKYVKIPIILYSFMSSAIFVYKCAGAHTVIHILFNNVFNNRPVSYTHLDVYKRQPANKL